MSYKIQGSPEWLAFRKTRIGASDCATILGINPWVTPYQLWERKLGLAPEEEENAAMSKGKALEPIALRKYQDMTGESFSPQVIESKDIACMFASLDGLNADGTKAVEIKCSDKAYRDALNGIIPDYYKAQMMHQMIVTGIRKMDYLASNGKDCQVLEYEFDYFWVAEILEKEKAFYECMITKTPPALTDKDYLLVDDDEFKKLEEIYVELDQNLKKIEIEKEAIRKLIIESAGNHNIRGSKIKVSKSFPKGVVDYKSIPELFDVDLEKYRKPGSVRYTINTIP